MSQASHLSPDAPRFPVLPAQIDLPAIEVPEPVIEEDAPRQALVSFGDDWVTAPAEP